MFKVYVCIKLCFYFTRVFFFFFHFSLDFELFFFRVFYFSLSSVFINSNSYHHMFFYAGTHWRVCGCTVFCNLLVSSIYYACMMLQHTLYSGSTCTHTHSFVVGYLFCFVSFLPPFFIHHHLRLRSH